ncbi:hypothetical protein [Escherichia sp. E2748]|uniref:hypothetical protein n=1 Tax=Escherichia sp. E2748 TaxID=2044460 RepID=UPI0023EF5693|nr:hypothetical protein [Escherichia sp. E2748]
MASAGGSPARCVARAESECASDWSGNENQNRAGSRLHRRASAGRRKRDDVYRQVENSFTQPNAAMNIQMLEWALDVTKGSKGEFTGAVLRQR